MIAKTTKMKLVLKILVMSIILGSSAFAGDIYYDHTAYAEDSKDKTPQDDVYKANYGDFKGDKTYYELDHISDEEDAAWYDWILSPLDSVKGEGKNIVGYTLFFLVNFTFTIILLMTNIMIGIMEFAFNSQTIVNTLIDKVSTTVQATSGIQNGKFTTAGLYGGFVSLICTITVIYTLYQYVVKRAKIAAFSSILQTIIAFTIALLMFSNMPTMMKGINTLSTSLTSMVIPNTVTSKDGETVVKSTREAMYDNLFNIFVHKPYMMLQYSTTDETEIGSKRIINLLKEKPSSKARSEVVEKEVNDYGNLTMTSANTHKRLAFILFAMFLNGINSIPVYLLALAIIMCNFWFLIMAMVAPFALLWGSLPGQFGVITRYFLELCIPFFLKAGLVMISVFMFGITEILYGIQSIQQGVIGFILSAIIQMMLFATLFILRKRIFDIFSLGSKELSNLRAELGKTKENVMKPVKSAVRTSASVAGAGIGAAIAGPAGAKMGANLGSLAGSVATGEKSMSDGVQRGTHTLISANSNKGSQMLDKEGNSVPKDFFSKVSKDNTTDNEASLKQNLMKNGFSDKDADNTIMELRRQGVSNLTEEESNAVHADIQDQAGKGRLDKTAPRLFAEGITNNRDQEERDRQQVSILSNIPNDQVAETSESINSSLPNQNQQTTESTTPARVTPTLEGVGRPEVNTTNNENLNTETPNANNNSNLNTQRPNVSNNENLNVQKPTVSSTENINTQRPTATNTENLNTQRPMETSNQSTSSKPTTIEKQATVVDQTQAKVVVKGSPTIEKDATIIDKTVATANVTGNLNVQKPVNLNEATINHNTIPSLKNNQLPKE